MTDEKSPVMEVGGGSERGMYTPHLKKVLKSYQASATKSLHGPNSVLGVWQGSESDDAASSASPTNPLLTTPTSSGESTSAKSSKPSTSRSVKDTIEYDSFLAPPPFPIQQPPIFTPADQTGCEKSETVLESETIACFDVGGEERLCLPQILNTVLRDFSLQQINFVCDNLHIYCSRCNQGQLEVLKATGILPYNAPSCGLITKTDAQRLCAALLDTNPLIVTKTDMKPPFQVKVYHECFGHCDGLYTPDLFVHPLAPCIECLDCHALLSPQKFVCHVHHMKETRTCHWGFDVFRWRAYILLADELEEDVQLKDALLEMKERFGAKYKRKQILEESCDPSQKRVRVDNCFSSYPFGVDPMLVYYYSHPHLWDNAFQTYPSVITKDGKTLLIPPESFPQLLQKSMNFRTRLALNPASVQKLIPMKLPEESTVFAAYHSHKSETLSKRPHIKKDPDHDSISYFDSEDAYSDTSFSTLSAGTEDGLGSNLDDEDELQPSTESELVEFKKLLADVEAPLCTKILSEVEMLVAKYRKCLNVAVQGKKLYQMELEKVHYTQRGKLLKLRERNKNLQKEIEKLKTSGSNSEHFQSQTAKVTAMKPITESLVPDDKNSSMDNSKSKTETHLDDIENILESDVISPPKQQPSSNPDDEPIGK